MEDNKLQEVNDLFGVILPSNTIFYNINFINNSIYINGIPQPRIKLVRGKTYLFSTEDIDAINMSGIIFSHSPDNRLGEQYTDGINIYSERYMSFVPSDSTRDTIFYSHSGVTKAGSYAQVISTTVPPTTTATEPPLVFQPIDSKVDPRSIDCDTQGACVKPTGKGRRSDIRFNPPDYNFLDPYQESTTTATTTETTITTSTTFSPGIISVNPASFISYPGDESKQNSRLDKKEYFDPNDFIFNAFGADTASYGDYSTFKFDSNSEFEVIYTGEKNSPYIDFDYIIVGGGGGGGQPGYGGGGGGGAVASGVTRLVPGKYLVKIGQGGEPNENGESSVFNFISAGGGGAGGAYLSNSKASDGSTGGAGANSASTAPYPNITSSNIFSNFGGSSLGSTYSGGGGGGGAGANAESISTDPESRFIGSNGGNGISISLFDNTSTHYAGGGGGGGEVLFVGNGGLGGGGSYESPDGSDGLGAGGVGAFGSIGSLNAGRGSSGSIILRYYTREKRIFDENYSDALKITDYRIRDRNITVFFNPGSLDNLADGYYVDYKDSSESNFSSISFFLQENNKNFITFNLPSYGRYDIRVSVRDGDQIKSGPPIGVTSLPFLDKQEIEVSKINESSISVSLINPNAYLSYKLRTSVDEINWSTKDINNTVALELPLDFSGETSLYIQIGYNDGNGNVVWLEDTFVYEDLPLTETQDALPPPSEVVVLPIPGGLSVSFEPNSSAKNTLVEIKNNDNQKIEYFTLDQNTHKLKYADISNASSFDVSLYSIGQDGYNESHSITNISPLQFSTETNPPLFSSYNVLDSDNIVLNFSNGVKGSILHYIVDDIGDGSITRESYVLTSDGDYSINLTLDNRPTDNAKVVKFIYEAIDNNGQSSFSESIFMTVDANPLSEQGFFDFKPQDYIDDIKPPLNFSVTNPQDGNLKNNYDFILSWDNNQLNDSYDVLYHNIEIKSSAESITKNIRIDANKNQFYYTHDNIFERNSTTNFNFAIQTFSKYGQSSVEVLEKSITVAKDPNPVTKLSNDNILNNFTFSFNPPKYIGSFSSIDSFRVIIKKHPYDSISETITLPHDVNNFTYKFEEDGVYLVGVASIVIDSEGSKNLGPYSFQTVNVSELKISRPIIQNVGFSEHNIFGFVATHSIDSEEVIGYRVLFDIDGNLTSFNVDENNLFGATPSPITIPTTVSPNTSGTVSISTLTNNGAGNPYVSTFKSPPGPREPKEPIIVRDFKGLNGSFLTIRLPEYIGWFGEYFYSENSKIHSLNFKIDGGGIVNFINIPINANQGKEISVFIPLKQNDYEISVSTVTWDSVGNFETSIYSEPYLLKVSTSDIVFTRTDPNGNVTSAFTNVFVTGKDSTGKEFDFEESPEITLFYGGVYYAESDGRLSISTCPDLPYAQDIPNLEKYEPERPALCASSIGGLSSPYINNSFSTSESGQVKKLQFEYPGIYYYGIYNPYSREDYLFNNYTMSVPIGGTRIIVIPLELNVERDKYHSKVDVSFARLLAEPQHKIHRIEIDASYEFYNEEKVVNGFVKPGWENISINGNIVAEEGQDSVSTEQKFTIDCGKRKYSGVVRCRASAYSSGNIFIASSELYVVEMYANIRNNLFDIESIYPDQSEFESQTQSETCTALTFNFQRQSYTDRFLNIPINYEDNSRYEYGTHHIHDPPYPIEFKLQSKDGEVAVTFNSHFNKTSREYEKLAYSPNIALYDLYSVTIDILNTINVDDSLLPDDLLTKPRRFRILTRMSHYPNKEDDDPNITEDYFTYSNYVQYVPPPEEFAIVCVGESSECRSLCDIPKDFEIVSRGFFEREQCENYPGASTDPDTGQAITSKEAADKLCGRDIRLLVPSISIQLGQFEQSSRSITGFINIGNALNYVLDNSKIFTSNGQVSVSSTVNSNQLKIDINFDDVFSGDSVLTINSGFITTGAGTSNQDYSFSFNVPPPTTPPEPTTTSEPNNPFIPKGASFSSIQNKIGDNPNFCEDEDHKVGSIIGVDTEFYEPKPSATSCGAGGGEGGVSFIVLRNNIPVATLTSDAAFCVDTPGTKQTMSLYLNPSPVKITGNRAIEPENYPLYNFELIHTAGPINIDYSTCGLDDIISGNAKPFWSKRYTSPASVSSVPSEAFVFNDGSCGPSIYFLSPQDPNNGLVAFARCYLRSVGEEQGKEFLLVSRTLILDLAAFCDLELGQEEEILRNDPHLESFNYYSHEEYRQLEFYIDEVEEIEFGTPATGPKTKYETSRSYTTMAGDGFYGWCVETKSQSTTNEFLSVYKTESINATVEPVVQQFISIENEFKEFKLSNIDDNLSLLIGNSRILNFALDKEVCNTVNGVQTCFFPTNAAANLTSRDLDLAADFLGNQAKVSITIQGYSTSGRTVNTTAKLERPGDNVLLKLGLIDLNIDPLTVGGIISSNINAAISEISNNNNLYYLNFKDCETDDNETYRIISEFKSFSFNDLDSAVSLANKKLSETTLYFDMGGKIGEQSIGDFQVFEDIFSRPFPDKLPATRERQQDNFTLF